MNRNNGMLAGVIVALTLFGVSSLPNRSAESPSAEGAKKPGAASSTDSHDSAKSTAFSPCTEIAKRMRRFVPQTDGPIESWRLPASCYAPGGSLDRVKPVQTHPDVQFAIAIVPDPVSTHLPLLFDRIVESIQQAAQDDNYTYDSSWFPWETTGKDYSRLLDQQAAEALQDVQQSHPGVMTFRQASHSSDSPYDGGLVVFLVGEQPTGGVRDDQIANAIAWITSFGGLSGEHGLRILGPTFSGSLPSLRLALDRYINADKQGVSKIWVSSGTVSSDSEPSRFNEWIRRSRPGSYFRTAMESDSIMVERFCRYLVSQHYRVDRVAFLSEDETAFGKAAAKGNRACKEAIDFHYPRDIATLRSAYQAQSVLNSGKASSNGSAPSTALRGDLSEPANSNHDTVRSYGGQLTPLAQEAFLLDIANRLGEKEIQFIILRSTSSLDSIFLSEFLRRYYPEGRIVIDGSDLLFNRGAEARSLRGVMVLSPYPLLTAEQEWTPPLLVRESNGFRTFGEDTAEASYIAARELFRDPKLAPAVPIPDYASPAWARGPADDPTNGSAENQRPPTWVTVIGHRRFWPLAVLNSNTLKASDFAGKLPASFDRGDGPPLGDKGRSPLHPPTTMWLFLIALIAWAMVHLYFCFKGSIVGTPRACAYFAPVNARQHPALIAFSSVLLGMMATAVAASSGLFSWFHSGTSPFREPSTGWRLATAVILILAGALAASGLNFRLPPLCASGSSGTNTKLLRKAVAGIAILGLLAFLAIQIGLVSGSSSANLIPAYWRSMNLLSGVSPLLPEVLLIAGAYLWSWCNLRGLAHFGDDRPLLPALDDLPKSVDGKSRVPMFSREKAALPIEVAAFPLTRKYLARFLLIFGAAFAVCSVALQGGWVRTLGERRFGCFIFVWICLHISLVFADGAQMWQAWNQLRQLLVYLDRLPLRRTLCALKGLAWGSIWKMSGNVLGERYRVISLQIECLRHLNNSIPAWTPSNPLEDDSKKQLQQKLSECQVSVGKFAYWFVNLEKDTPPADLRDLRHLQEDIAATAGLAMKSILLPEWQKEKESLIFSRASLSSKAGESDDQAEPNNEMLNPYVRAAEEFFILPYVAFIQNILGRIRTIALGGLWLFVGTTLAVSSYPFEPLTVLGGIFLTVFVIVGGMSILVYSQMSRDATLSHIANTRPGELGLDFWTRLLGFGIGPLIGLLTTLFPSITDFAFSWLQPGMNAIK